MTSNVLRVGSGLSLRLGTWTFVNLLNHRDLSVSEPRCLGFGSSGEVLFSLQVYSWLLPWAISLHPLPLPTSFGWMLLFTWWGAGAHWGDLSALPTCLHLCTLERELRSVAGLRRIQIFCVNLHITIKIIKVWLAFFYPHCNEFSLSLAMPIVRDGCLLSLDGFINF